jgi:hypothetical protein
MAVSISLDEGAFNIFVLQLNLDENDVAVLPAPLEGRWCHLNINHNNSRG